MEEIQIVNENDEIIGYKKRGTLKKEDIYRVSALWLENSKGESLLAKRTLTKEKDPGLWGPAVTGTVEKEETYESNIFKESQEEIGLINFSPEKLVKVRITHPRNQFIQWFLFKIDKDINDFKIQKEEVERIKWISKKELFKLVNEDSKELTASFKFFVKEFIMKNG